jgi:hypothetical protein
MTSLGKEGQGEEGSSTSEEKSIDAPTDEKQAQHQCEFCGCWFPSRNQMFKHLRQAADSPCGAAIQKSQTLNVPPSVVKKELRKVAHAEAKRARRRNKTGQTVQQDQHCLWLGDLPLPWTRHGSNYKRLRALLRAHLPRTIPQPWIKTVQRKAYRTKLVVDDATGRTIAGGVYLGYAIVVFRDDLECSLVLNELNGRQVTVDSVFSQEDLATNQDFAAMAASDVPPFCIKVRPVENITQRNHSEIANALDKCKSAIVGRDPPLVDQLKPLAPLVDQLKPLATNELLVRANRFSKQENGSSEQSRVLDDQPIPIMSMEDAHSAALAQAVAAMSQSTSCRPEIHHQGRLIPSELCDKLLTILKNLRWAVPNHRPGLTAERYLILLTSVTNDLFYQELRDACRQLVNWADPSYYYSGVAVTKNFVSSPHIDDRDQTFQYAVSLGDFTGGGELCVDGLDAHEKAVIHVVDTHNRVARIDGRRVHWVRTWRGGDRYSLIFYDTSNRRPTPVLSMGIDDYAASTPSNDGSSVT